VTVHNLDDEHEAALCRISASFDDPPHHWQLAYAVIKIDASGLRRLGFVQRAQRLEDACDRIYQLIPEHLKW